MTKLLNSALVLMLAASLFACKKEKGSLSKTELLTRAPWKQINSEVGTGGVYTSDWSTWDECDKDDIVTFKTDKTYQVTEGASKCNSSDPDVIDNGIWQFSADEKMLIVEGDSVNILTLDENRLILSINSGSDGYRSTFTH